MARTSASARPLTDHDEIRRWAEERSATPSCVRGTGGGEDIGMIRLDFPGYSGENSLEEISWDEWFQKFDERGLALIVQDSTARGQKSNFNKLVSRETVEERAEGRRSRNGGSRARTAGRKRSRSQSRTRSRSRARTRSNSSARSRSGRTRSSRTRSSNRSSASTRSTTGNRSRRSNRSRSTGNSRRAKTSGKTKRSAATRSQAGSRSKRRNVTIEVECPPESRTSRSRTTARSTSGSKRSPRSSGHRGTDRRKAA